MMRRTWDDARRIDLVRSASATTVRNGASSSNCPNAQPVGRASVPGAATPLNEEQAEANADGPADSELIADNGANEEPAAAEADNGANEEPAAEAESARAEEPARRRGRRRVRRRVPRGRKPDAEPTPPRERTFPLRDAPQARAASSLLTGLLPHYFHAVPVDKTGSLALECVWLHRLKQEHTPGLVEFLSAIRAAGRSR